MNLKFEGLKEMQRAVRRIAERHPKEVKKVLVSVSERIMTRSKREFVPVDTGNLKSTGHVEVDKNRIRVTLIYGGPSATYAIDQHENMTHRHPVGGPKYLERPLMQEIPGMAQEIARKAPYKP